MSLLVQDEVVGEADLELEILLPARRLEAEVTGVDRRLVFRNRPPPPTVTRIRIPSASRLKKNRRRKMRRENENALKVF